MPILFFLSISSPFLSISISLHSHHSLHLHTVKPGLVVRGHSLHGALPSLLLEIRFICFMKFSNLFIMFQ